MLTSLDPKSLVGTFRRFGPQGPAYKILEVLRDLGGGDFLMRVEEVQSGKQMDYRCSRIIEDPKEQ